MDTATTTGMVVAKNGAYVAAFLTGTMYLGLNPKSVLILIVFIILDIIMGVTKSISLHGGSSIKSSIFERGVVAKALIVAIPVNLALAGKGIGFDLAPLAQGTITVLILSEFYSLLGNYYAIRTGTERVEFDAVAYAVQKLKDLLRAFIQDD